MDRNPVLQQNARPGHRYRYHRRLQLPQLMLQAQSLALARAKRSGGLQRRTDRTNRSRTHDIGIAPSRHSGGSQCSPFCSRQATSCHHRPSRVLGRSETGQVVALWALCGVAPSSTAASARLWLRLWLLLRCYKVRLGTENAAAHRVFIPPPRWGRDRWLPRTMKFISLDRPFHWQHLQQHGRLLVCKDDCENPTVSLGERT